MRWKWDQKCQNFVLLLFKKISRLEKDLKWATLLLLSTFFTDIEFNCYNFILILSLLTALLKFFSFISASPAVMQFCSHRKISSFHLQLLTEPIKCLIFECSLFLILLNEFFACKKNPQCQEGNANVIEEVKLSLLPTTCYLLLVAVPH